MTRISASDFVVHALAVIDPRKLLQDLRPDVNTCAVSFVLNLAYHGFGLIQVECGRRTIGEEMALYGHGRSAKELVNLGMHPEFARPTLRRVTWCLPAESKHVLGDAFDLCFSAYDHPAWDIVRYLANLHGLTWGGNWKVRDYGHFEKD